MQHTDDNHNTPASASAYRHKHQRGDNSQMLSTAGNAV